MLQWYFSLGYLGKIGSIFYSGPIGSQMPSPRFSGESVEEPTLVSTGPDQEIAHPIAAHIPSMTTLPHRVWGYSQPGQQLGPSYCSVSTAAGENGFRSIFLFFQCLQREQLVFTDIITSAIFGLEHPPKAHVYKRWSPAHGAKRLRDGGTYRRWELFRGS
jgi:hypothetical protein